MAIYTMHRILIIDDDPVVRGLLKEFLEKKNLEVSAATDGESGLELLKAEKFDLLLLDHKMPKKDGMDVLREISAEKIDIPTLMITGYGSIPDAVEAMKLGAFDYITKPFEVLDDLFFKIKRALDVSQLHEENSRLKKELKKKFNPSKIIGNSLPIQEVIRFIEKIADTDSTVLITGESGTGKELVAKTIHYNSSRSRYPFIPLNCAAIPKDILESELFGHEKGAFTGAVNTRLGRFELANNGTLFLDEIGELAPTLQVKLLRVLQEKEFERVGGIKTIKVDVRIVAATNRDLEKAVADGLFREDLYYRLNVIPIHLPPLRRMKEDIPLLVEHFIDELSRKKKKDPPKITPEIMDCMVDYRWPGNVRELENLVERLIILKEGDTITPDDLPDRFLEKRKISRTGLKSQPLSSSGVDLNLMLDEIENSMIMQALEMSKGVKSKAASLLGLNRTTLIEKMKKKSIDFQFKSME